jgi:LysM repeat protein
MGIGTFIKYIRMFVFIVFITFNLWLSNGVYSNEFSNQEVTTFTKQQQNRIADKIKIVDGKKFYIYHVQKGDSWYGIAKKYGITYPEIRIANKYSDDKLTINEEVLIPVEKLKSNDPYYDKNYIDSKVINTTEINEIHRVEKSETLFGIAKKYHVTVAEIKKWNNLKSDKLKIGQKLIVSKTAANKIPGIKNNTNSKPLLNNNSDTEKEIKEPKPEMEPENKIDSYEGSGKKPGETFENGITSNDEKNKIIFASSRKKIEEHGFATRLNDSDTNEKYFGLHRNAPPGTIIRVENSNNKKLVFIKVTGNLPPSFVNDDIIISLSKEAAEKLGAVDKKFEVDLLYGIDKE